MIGLSKFSSRARFEHEPIEPNVEFGSVFEVLAEPEPEFSSVRDTPGKRK
jgi:hypothetical protein